MKGIYIRPIAHIRTPYPEKFGIPRQSGIVPLESEIVFEKEYANSDALRGLDGFSHLWLLWQFSLNRSAKFSPTVRPPREGGNRRLGVFATRSPNRPNPIGLSCVKIERISGTSIVVSGADLANGTPIFDIKPYLPYCDSVPFAKGGFAENHLDEKLEVTFENGAEGKIPPHLLSAVVKILEDDPRPHYQADPNRVYGLRLENLNVKFRVSGKALAVIDVERQLYCE